MNIIAPCKDCEERFLGCHANCSLYNKFKEEKKEHDILIKSLKAEQSRLNSYELQKARRLKKYGYEKR